jgi:hypothetical protein
MYLNPKHLLIGSIVICASVMLNAFDEELLQTKPYTNPYSNTLSISDLVEENRKLKADIEKINTSLSAIRDFVNDLNDRVNENAEIANENHEQYGRIFKALQSFSTSVENQLDRQNLTNPDNFTKMLQASSAQISLIIINELRTNQPLRWQLEQIIQEKTEFLPSKIGREVDNALHYDRLMRNK